MMTLRGSGALKICNLHHVIAIIVLFKLFAKFSESLIQQYCGARANAPPPRPGGPNFGDALIRYCQPHYKKHGENTTLYLQCLHRLNGNNAAVLGKRVLMFNEKRFENICSIIKSLLCSRPSCKPFTPPSLQTSALKVKMFTRTWSILRAPLGLSCQQFF